MFLKQSEDIQTHIHKYMDTFMHFLEQMSNEINRKPITKLHYMCAPACKRYDVTNIPTSGSS